MIWGKAFSGPPGVCVSDDALVHPSALLFGDVRVSGGASIWPNVVMRAEAHFIEIGEGANIQDFVMVHVGFATPTVIGPWCSITHHATVHGATVGADCLIGINATLMDGVVIGENSIVAGHAFVKEGTIIPPNSIVMGQPASVRASRDSKRANRSNAVLYKVNAEAYAEGEFRVWSRPDTLLRAQEEVQRLLGG